MHSHCFSAKVHRPNASTGEGQLQVATFTAGTFVHLFPLVRMSSPGKKQESCSYSHCSQTFLFYFTNPSLSNHDESDSDEQINAQTTKHIRKSKGHLIKLFDLLFQLLIHSIIINFDDLKIN